MANLQLFKSLIGKLIPKADAVNEAGGPAYAFSAKHALAQYAVTGCLNHTYYASAGQQLDQVMKLCAQVDAETIARTAIYTRESGYMKDTPALLVAVLSTRDTGLFVRTFDRVIDNGKMLRNFVQIMRSGAVGRKSLGSAPKRKVREWLEKRSLDMIFDASVGQSPSLGDILRMVHPKPADPAREAFYGYLLGRPHDAALLPERVRAFEAYKSGDSKAVPDVPFQMLTSLNLDSAAWKEIARNAPWQMTRMNLNTFQRHGVFEDRKLVELIAKRLGDEGAVRRARVFPYQLMSAYMSAGKAMPSAISEALQDAMEAAIGNVPSIQGQVYVCADVSGSMSSPVTGRRKGSTTSVRCIDVAALMAAAILRRNRTAEVLPFESDVVTKLTLNPRDTVMTNAKMLASIGGGGTNCSAPLAMLNRKQAKGDLVIFVSDNESWVDAGRGRGTATMAEWNAFRKRNPTAKLVCIDIQPYGTTQAQERDDILNVGGFSDQVFSVVADFAAGRLASDHWMSVIDAVIV